MACCEICGSRCHGTRCAACEQIAANEVRHGDSVPEREDGAEWTVEQQGLDGGAHSGQATLDGGVAREGER